MIINEQIKAKLIQLYNSAPKRNLEGFGDGWVDQTTYAFAVNSARINYKGTNNLQVEIANLKWRCYRAYD